MEHNSDINTMQLVHDTTHTHQQRRREGRHGRKVPHDIVACNLYAAHVANDSLELGYADHQIVVCCVSPASTLCRS